MHAKLCDLCGGYYPQALGVEYEPFVQGPSVGRHVRIKAHPVSEDLCSDCLMRALSAIVEEDSERGGEQP